MCVFTELLYNINYYLNLFNLDFYFPFKIKKLSFIYKISCVLTCVVYILSHYANNSPNMKNSGDLDVHTTSNPH